MKIVSTIKNSVFIGLAISGIFILLLKIFQPISYLHLTIFAYFFVLSSLLSGILIHKKFSQLAKANSRNIQIDFPLHRGKFATLHTKDGEIHRGRFQVIDNEHVILDYVVNIRIPKKVKSLLMIEKSEVKRLEVD
jgi:hypothetical protein